VPDRPEPASGGHPGERLPEPTVEDTEAGAPLPAEKEARRRARAHREDDAAPDLDARDRSTSPRRKQAGPGRPGRGPGADVDPADVPEAAPLPDVPPSDPTR
jgi:hypothetical protein